MAMMLLLGLVLGADVVMAAPAETLSLTVVDGLVSVEAVNAPLDRVLIELGAALRARVLVESAVAADVRRARIDASFSRVSPVMAIRRLLGGRTHALRYGPSGIQEIVVQADGKTGYLELSAPGRTTPPGTPVPWSPPERPADDPVKVAALRRTALDAADAGARREALEELADIRDAGLLVDTLVQMLAQERETSVLMTVLDVAGQQKGRIPPEALRAFATSDRDGSVRAEALELLAAHDGVEPATRALLRTLAGSDGSRHVREEATRILATLERPPASRAPSAPP